MSIKIANDTANGNIILKGQNVAGDRTITMPNIDCELAPRMQLMTAQNSTSGTSIDFTGIPSWVKKITVMFNGVSTNGASAIQVQLGDSEGIENTGYISSASYAASTGGTQTSSTSGLQLNHGTAAANTTHGFLTIVNLSLNTWVHSSVNIPATNSGTDQAGGSKTLSGTLDRIRVTTVNGTDTFDAGQINVLYEG